MKPTDLQEHPEGGRFKRVFCSDVTILHQAKGERAAISHIYFSLGSGEISRMHRVTNDEVWNLYRGEGLYLYVWDGTHRQAERIEISAGSKVFCHVVSAGMWQAAVPIGEEVLVGCSVAPAFDFEDFTLLEDEPEMKDVFLAGNASLGFLADKSSDRRKR